MSIASINQSVKMKTGEQNDIEIIDVDAPAAATKKRKSKKRKLDADDNDAKPASKKSSPPPSSLLNNHPHSQLPSFLSEAFSELYAQDGLVVLGRGLGWLSLLAAFVRYYGDPECNGVEDDDEDDSVAEAAHASASLPPPKYPGDDDMECKAQHAPTKKQPKKPPLIFVLNLRDNERQVLFSTLSSWGCPPDQLPTLITNEAGQSEERAVKYARGGVFVITSRILIVDLLNGTANAKAIDGMLVAHAENVDETSTEAFILRIFRSQKYFMENSSSLAGCGSQNNHGFIKAFTDNATSLVAGFAKTEKILKALQVPKIYLFPRFHSAVAEELEVNPPIVEELHQSLTPSMKDIQDHLKMAVRAVMRELKAKSPMVDFSVFLGGGDSSKKRKKNDYTNVGKIGKRTDDSKNDFTISLEQCITTNFDRVISRQLDGDWHRLSFKVKQLVKDLGKLRQLFHHLIHYDSIDFLNFLQGIKAMNAVSMEPSLWIGEYSGENVFRIAKERVYRVSQKGKLITVLEENMKESLLQQVLTEIENRWEKKVRDSEEAENGSFMATRSNNVLLMVKDERALKSVREYLVEGGKRAMATKWLRFLERANEKTRSLLNSMEGGLKSLSGEQRLLYEEEPVVRNTIFPRDGNTAHAHMQEVDFAMRHKNLAASQRKRRKIAEEKSRGRTNADLYEDQALFEEKIEASRLPDAQPQTYNDESDDSSIMSCSSEDEDERMFKVDPIEGMSLFIRAFSQIEEGEAALLLQDLQPDTVIMYDSDPSFIRTLEIYANTMASTSEDEKKRLQVFFLLYESCAEEIGFTKMLEREAESFNRLIDYKKRMPSLVSSTFNTFSTQEMQQSHGGVGGSYAGGTLPLSMDTRTGRGKQNVIKERRDIAVDVREFRAKLPSVLHQGRMRIAPATLIVGDYILSDVHCVERKSISDFYQSMDNSSRLKEQAEKMAKYYKIPILLLEFDPDKTFQLQNANDLGGEIRKNSITSKLCILVTAFPMLRILWSRSPHETLKVFKKLKRNHQEVDVDKAIEIGTNDAMDELLGGGPGGCYNEDDDEGDGANEAAVQMLLRLPGVTSHNARNIMKECDSIAELAEMSREKLKLLAGQKAGQKLFTFFRQPFSG